MFERRWSQLRSVGRNKKQQSLKKSFIMEEYGIWTSNPGSASEPTFSFER